MFAACFIHMIKFTLSKIFMINSSKIYSIPVSQGSLCNWQKALSANLAGYEYVVKEELLKQEVTHADETGLNISGKNKWVHVLSNAYYTYYGLHDKRGYTAMEEIGLLTPDIQVN